MITEEESKLESQPVIQNESQLDILNPNSKNINKTLT